MLARVLSAALPAVRSLGEGWSAKAPPRAKADVNGIEAFPVEVEVNSGWGDTKIVMLSCNLPSLWAAMLGQGWKMTFRRQ